MHQISFYTFQKTDSQDIEAEVFKTDSWTLCLSETIYRTEWHHITIATIQKIIHFRKLILIFDRISVHPSKLISIGSTKESKNFFFLLLLKYSISWITYFTTRREKDSHCAGNSSCNQRFANTENSIAWGFNAFSCKLGLFRQINDRRHRRFARLHILRSHQWYQTLGYQKKTDSKQSCPFALPTDRSGDESPAIIRQRW